jgi:hypothetical protein
MKRLRAEYPFPRPVSHKRRHECTIKNKEVLLGQEIRDLQSFKMYEVLYPSTRLKLARVLRKNSMDNKIRDKARGERKRTEEYLCSVDTVQYSIWNKLNCLGRPESANQQLIGTHGLQNASPHSAQQTVLYCTVSIISIPCQSVSHSAQRRHPDNKPVPSASTVVPHFFARWAGIVSTNGTSSVGQARQWDYETYATTARASWAGCLTSSSSSRYDLACPTLRGGICSDPLHRGSGHGP